MKPVLGQARMKEEPAGSRRAFFRTAAAGAAGAALFPLAELAPQKSVLRPPGALPEKEFLRTCVLCQECVRVCPSGALRPALLESGLLGIGTPVLVPRQGGCALNPSCPDLCASACPVGAIRPVTKETMKIGLAVVHREACLAWDQGAKCLVCVEACLNSAAIPYNGRVTVDANRCTGCGRCESGCPVPGSAIRVEPVMRSTAD
jgi:MauM/NapG family ferredoxin protein